jgi:hypothetical protein
MGDLWLLPRDGAAIALKVPRIEVGRDAAAGLLLADSSVSRHHAVIERTGSGWTVTDRGSSNGTWVDEQRVSRAVLAPGQRLRFGAVAFAVSAEAAPAVPQPASPPLPPPLAAPPGKPVTAAAAAGAEVLTPAQACEVLGVLPGAPCQEVRRRYQAIYNDYQVRLTNAPTPALKRLYQRHLQEARAAAETLCPGQLGE